MLQFTTDQFTYDGKNRIFVAESSDLDLNRRYWNSLREIPVETSIELTNPKTKRSEIFTYHHSDVLGDETYGWNYKASDNLKLLIIND